MSENTAEELKDRALANIQAARTRGDHVAEGHGWVQLAGARRMLGLARETAFALEKALGCFEAAGSALDVVRAQLHLSFFERTAANHAAADGWLAKVAMPLEAMPPDVRALWQEQELYRAGHSGDDASFVAGLEAAAEASLAAGDGYQAVRFTIARIELLELRERMEEADRAAEAALSDGRLRAHLRDFQRLRIVQVARLLRKGQDGEAEKELDRICRLCVREQWPMTEVSARCTASTVWIERGEYDRAGAQLERGRKVSLEIVDPGGYANCTRLQAMLHMAKGERAEAFGALLRGKTTLNDLQYGLGDLTLDGEFEDLKRSWGQEDYDQAVATFYSTYRVIA